MSRKHAIKVAKYHRETAQSPGLRLYWDRVVKSLKRENKK